MPGLSILISSRLQRLGASVLSDLHVWPDKSLSHEDGRVVGPDWHASHTFISQTWEPEHVWNPPRMRPAEIKKFVPSLHWLLMGCCFKKVDFHYNHDSAMIWYGTNLHMCTLFKSLEQPQKKAIHLRTHIKLPGQVGFEFRSSGYSDLLITIFTPVIF
jgi:hypothetical protein